MNIVKKSEVVTPALGSRVVMVDCLGGAVSVREMTLRQRFEMLEARDKPIDDQICEVLARAVVDADGVQLFTAEEWALFGARNLSVFMDLWEQAKDVSRLGGAEKN